ncbi:hypothetical protein LINGRAHAP2_LOCUS28648 [Linum grandiflorum]
MDRWLDSGITLIDHALNVHGVSSSSLILFLSRLGNGADTGRFVKAFAANLRSCSITRAEMRAIDDGLKLAWSLGIRRIRVQSDSRAVIAIFAKDSELDHEHATLVLQFKELCSRQ